MPAVTHPKRPLAINTANFTDAKYVKSFKLTTSQGKMAEHLEETEVEGLTHLPVPGQSQHHQMLWAKQIASASTSSGLSRTTSHTNAAHLGKGQGSRTNGEKRKKTLKIASTLLNRKIAVLFHRKRSVTLSCPLQPHSK